MISMRRWKPLQAEQVTQRGFDLGHLILAEGAEPTRELVFIEAGEPL